MQAMLAIVSVAVHSRKAHLRLMENTTKRSSEGLVVVLGAGQIGTLLVDKLLARGVRVRQVRRGAGTPLGRGASTPRPGLELLNGDLEDHDFARRAMEGASLVYHCLNARYDQWPAHLLPLTRGVLAGAKAADAPLVMLDCLYMYGRPDGAMREDTPMRPCSKKGALRQQQAEEVLAAHARGDVRVAIARASDFFGPNVGNALLGDRFWPVALAGKPVEVFGDIDQPHSYSYSEDVADGLLALGGHERAFGRVWHLPVAPALSTRQMVEQIHAALGLAGAPRYRKLNNVVLRALGVFMPMLREVAEMTYQWQLPYVLDDTQIRAELGLRATPVEEQIARTVAWARAEHAPAAQAASLATVLRP
jgi:nucleoside-diphosphate-sugar epimerase